ncbi:MAG: pyroglutamyl-peptidase I [Planctomycetota bacterium]
MRILLTAFDPYDDWKENSSWLSLVQFLRDASQEFSLVTRRYPVDLQALSARLEKDLDTQFDAILHLGQSPGSSAIKLESIALNVAGCVEDRGEELPNLTKDGPLAFRSRMPVGRWADLLRSNNIPTMVSYHAGTFLCNATMYLSHYFYQDDPSAPFIGFIHLPLATEQVAQQQRPSPSLSTETMAAAIHLILRDLTEWYEALPESRA